jgi:hypothetical protein
MEMKQKKRKPTVVTSENRAEFMAKKLKLAKEEKPVMKQEKPYAIFKSGSDEVISHFKNEAEANAAYEKLGQKQADHAVGELSANERKKYGYQ